ncbi:hypothetical protein [Parasulfitobacter algicola]|uniref:Uncharacterized protein n=1 Tax=Parasulfitobacter algicola TaxID=2614809 RepID=A0ABX2IZZ6_9RHOB|nr:hypothetical protein [Sulfitobacter algicola]NSX56364.1 hypothetical protein [Sulfitobacter algicola]
MKIINILVFFAFLTISSAAHAIDIRCKIQSTGPDADWIAEDIIISLVPTGTYTIGGLPKFESIEATDRIIRKNSGPSVQAILQDLSEKRMTLTWTVDDFKDETGTKLLKLRHQSYDLSVRLTIYRETNKALVTTVSSARNYPGNRNARATGNCIL